MKPKIYGGDKGIILKIEKDYESECIILAQHGITDPKKKTVIEFYQAVNIIEKQNKNGSKGFKRGNRTAR